MSIDSNNTARDAVVTRLVELGFSGAHGEGRETKYESLQYFKTEGPLSAAMVGRHVAGEQPYTLFLSEPNGASTRLAVVDLDNKKKYATHCTDAQMNAVVAAISDATLDIGLRPLVVVSRSGSGRNLWFAWSRPQVCADVRAALRSCVEAAGLVEGKGDGVGGGQCEIYVNAGQGVALPFFGGNPAVDRDGIEVQPALLDSDDVVHVEPEPEEAPRAVAIAPPTRDLRERVRNALKCIPADDYDVWTKMGLAVKHEFGDEGRELWETWSRENGTFDERRDATKWDDLRPRGAITVRTVFYVARRHGWVDPQLPLTEFGVRERFVEQHGEVTRYIHQFEKWMHWHGGRWRTHPTIGVRLATATIQNIGEELKSIDDEKERQRALMWWRGAQSRRSVESVLALARHEPAVAVTPDQLDADPWMLGVRNGVLDLRTGELLANAPELLVTRVAGCEFRPDAACPRWLQFLDEIFAGNTDMIAYVQRILGYWLTGTTHERCVWFFQGEGDNGKSVLLAVLQALFYEYQVNCEPHTFTVKRDEGGAATPDIARLAGARLAIVHELSDKMTLNLPMVKRAAGGTDRMTARFLYGQPFEFMPQFKTVFITNRFPRINEDDEAVWKRIKVVHFPVQIPKHRQDGDLTNKLIAELPGILNWILEGLRQWLVGGLREPLVVSEETLKYRKSQNLLATWLEEGDVVVNEKARVKSSRLYEAFRLWCIEEQGIPDAQVMRNKPFTEALVRMGYAKEKRRDANWFVGVGLRAEVEASQF